MQALEFFYTHSGYSYDPKTETAQQGRYRCAKAMRDAEQRALAMGARFDWDIDPDIDSSDFSDDPNPWPLWVCYAWLGDDIAASLGGIDLGRNGEPVRDPYARVIEAQLACEFVD